MTTDRQAAAAALARWKYPTKKPLEKILNELRFYQIRFEYIQPVQQWRAWTPDYSDDGYLDSELRWAILILAWHMIKDKYIKVSKGKFIHF